MTRREPVLALLITAKGASEIKVAGGDKKTRDVALSVFRAIETDLDDFRTAIRKRLEGFGGPEGSTHE